MKTYIELSQEDIINIITTHFNTTKQQITSNIISVAKGQGMGKYLEYQLTLKINTTNLNKELK